MFKRIVTVTTFLLFAGLTYLLFWPVPIDPVAWDAPEDQGYTGDFKPNDMLSNVVKVDLGGYTNPEDIAIGPDGLVYMSSRQGALLRFNPQNNQVSVFAETQGIPLGIEFGSDGYLYVADAYKGLLKVDKSGKVTLLANQTSAGSPILFADDLDVDSSGMVYFTDASTKFGAKAYGGGLPASLLDILEHGPNGRVLKYDPTTGETTTLYSGLSFANGLALTQDEKYILVVETGSYAIHKIPVADSSSAEVIVSNLPGFPDNINDNSDGSFWVGLASPRSPPVDQLSDQPFLRKVVQRLPAFLRPKPIRYSFIVRMDENGKILETLQDPAGGYALTTGAIDAPDGRIYISNLTENVFAYLQR
ncbi:MAG: SMP-30/gluconolactonase/LRE family protein [Pseudomonadota bacterium]